MFKFIHKSVYFVKKYAPEIKMVAGIVTSIASTALAVKVTLDTAEKIENESMDEKEVRNEVIKAAIPVVALEVVSCGLSYSSFKDMKNRYIGAVALYNGVALAFNNYRNRVRNKYGDEAEKELYYGETVTNREIDEKGNVIKEEKSLAIDGTSPYAIIFTEFLPNGEKNWQWDENKVFNSKFLKARESIANDILKRRGYIFLNEVLDGLGFPMTKAGAVVGWVKGNGDNIVDFNLYINERESAKNYLKDNNYPEESYILDFNVDGVIYDLL